MGLFLFRFWPVLIPGIIYILWYWRVAKNAKKTGAAAPHFRSGPWYWVVLSSFLIGIGCFLLLATSMDGISGNYVPPHVQAGKVVPGHMEQKP